MTTKLVLCGIEFPLSFELRLERDKADQIKEYTHSIDENTRRNQHSNGPFCVVRVDNAPRQPGVYAITVDGALVYVGECRDLRDRFGSSGYGRIAQRNCHHDGQSTNCKINAKILHYAKMQCGLVLWFHPTNKHKEVESLVLAGFRPPWNGRSPASIPKIAPPQETPEKPSCESQKSLNTETFREALLNEFRRASELGLRDVEVRGGDLHRRLGEYPGKNHRMPICCLAMSSLRQEGDQIVSSPPKGAGASLTIKYALPRPIHPKAHNGDSQ